MRASNVFLFRFVAKGIELNCLSRGRPIGLRLFGSPSTAAHRMFISCHRAREVFLST